MSAADGLRSLQSDPADRRHLCLCGGRGALTVLKLTNPARDPQPVGETTFHFVTDGIEAALERAFEAADGLDVRLGGGASTIQQYLAAGLVDELHVAVVPILLGGGERLFADPTAVDGYEVVEYLPSEAVAHVRLAKVDR